MTTEYTLKCPHCGSTELQSSDLIGATCSINGWSIEAGRLEPEYCGGSDVDWDSQKAANPARPYQCGECFTLLSNADLVAMLPKKAQKQVTPRVDAIPAPSVLARKVDALERRCIELESKETKFSLFYIEAEDCDGTHAYMVSAAGDEPTAKMAAEKQVLDVMGANGDSEPIACSIEHCRRIAGCDTEFFEVVGILAAN